MGPSGISQYLSSTRASFVVMRRDVQLMHRSQPSRLAIGRRSVIKGPQLLAVDRAGLVRRAVPGWAS